MKIIEVLPEPKPDLGLRFSRLNLGDMFVFPHDNPPSPLCRVGELDVFSFGSGATGACSSSELNKPVRRIEGEVRWWYTE